MNASEQSKEVYAHYGLAMFRAQCVEQSITQLLIFFDFFPEKVPQYASKEQWETDFDSFTGDLSSKTMGQLINKLQSLNAIDASNNAKLREALKKRNWLAHSFFVDHALTFLSEEGRLKMVKELEACTSFFGELEDILNPITFTLCEKYGLTKEKLREIELQLFTEANGDLPTP
jgi:hypothetical protein